MMPVCLLTCWGMINIRCSYASTTFCYCFKLQYYCIVVFLLSSKLYLSLLRRSVPLKKIIKLVVVLKKSPVNYMINFNPPLDTKKEIYSVIITYTGIFSFNLLFLCHEGILCDNGTTNVCFYNSNGLHCWIIFL